MNNRLVVKNMKVIVDAFGGDNAPLEIIKGCSICKEKYENLDIVLVGNRQIMEKTAAENGLSLKPFEICDAPDVITMEDEAGEVMKSKKDSSMAVGLRLLADGGGDAFLSAGNSGALIMGSTLIVKRLKGVKRPAFAPVMPTSKGPVLLIDSGANIEVRPEMLQQFGVMGSVYMENVQRVPNPRVALANVGTEDHKGGELQHEAFRLLKESGLNFIGNMEARDIPAGATDVIVADGFTGNIIIKMYEGVAKELMKKIKEMFFKNAKTKMAALMIKKDIYELKQYFDYNQYGAAPVMGLTKPVLKTHGSAKSDAVVTAMQSVIDYTNTNVTGKIADKIQQLKSKQKGTQTDEGA